MEYKIEEIKLLYRISPAKVHGKLKAGDRVCTDDEGLPELNGIFSMCKICFQQNTHEMEGKKNHTFIITI